MDIQYKVSGHIEPSPNLTRLFCELTGEEMIPDVERINSLIQSGSLALYTAWKDGAIVAMTSVIPFRTSISSKLWIEDVAVLSDCRGLGIGRKLVSYAMQDAPKRFFPGQFFLTSKPFRKAARQMYASFGFVPYDTDLFFKP